MVTVAILQGQKKKTPAAQAVPGCPALAGANAPTSAVTEHGDTEAPGAAVAGFIHGQSGAEGLILPPLPPGWFPVQLLAAFLPPADLHLHPLPLSLARAVPSRQLRSQVRTWRAWWWSCAASATVPACPRRSVEAQLLPEAGPGPITAQRRARTPGQAAAPLPLTGVAVGSPVHRAYPEILPRGEGPTPACSEPRAVLVMATQCF